MNLEDDLAQTPRAARYFSFLAGLSSSAPYPKRHKVPARSPIAGDQEQNSNSYEKNLPDSSLAVAKQ
jgi:hypothetical protein